MSDALIIDDNRPMADALTVMVKMLGVPARSVYGPRAALLALRETTPSIVFLDIGMSGVDGFEVMAYLRRMPHLAEVPVVFVTSDDQPETAQKIRRTGALGVIIKPVDLLVLERMLRLAGLIK